MSISLISTKYQIPPVGVPPVDRQRLLDKLNNGLTQSKRLILVSAPAGYGKTTLVSDWIYRIIHSFDADTSDSRAGHHLIRAAWITCDQDDDDLVNFLSYFVAALRQADLAIREGFLEALFASKPSKPDILATLLINELAEIEEDFILVLDDYHTITSQTVHDFSLFLLDHQPPRMHLVLVTRADPALPLARMRGRGQLLEIRQDELSFTWDESTAFLNRTMGLSLSPEQISILENRTEGWAAGLQLAALSMRANQDVSNLIETFSGGYEYIADYLTDEVLAQQSASVRSFLLQTSILERLSAPLCAAVTGDHDAQNILEVLREKNIFLIPLDQQKTWYRYHTLFADLLRNRLYHSQAGQIDNIHLRASRWYQDNDLLLPAIDHALAGHDTEQAAELLEQAVEPVFISGQVTILLRWLEALPAEAKDQHPVLWIFYGLALLWIGKSPGVVKTLLPNLHITTPELKGESCTLQALYAMTEGQISEAAHLAESALKELRASRSFFRCLAGDALGMASIMQCETLAAIHAFEQIAEIASQAGYVMFEIAALSHLAGLRLQHGQLHAAAMGYQRALDLAENRFGKCSPVTGNVLLGLGEVTREWGDLEGALSYFIESAAMFTQFSEIGLPIAYLSIARVKAAQGDWRSGQDFLDKARQFAQASQASRLNNRLVEEMQARFWIMRGNAGLAEQWARENGLLEHSITEIIEIGGQNVAGSEFNQNDYQTLARLFLAQDKVDEALQVIDPLLVLADKMGYKRRVIHILVLKVVALQQKNQLRQAVNVLLQALALAEPEGYQQLFQDEGEVMVPLLRLAVAQDRSQIYAKKILAAFITKSTAAVGTAGKTFESIVSAESILEPLSEREQEVLAMIAEGLSNRAIALRLHISLSTVKGHTANIYGKLGVNSRTQAIADAKRLGILKP